MLNPKDYQQRALDTLSDFLRQCTALREADTAFFRVTRQVFGAGRTYTPVPNLAGLPYVCIRIPTGGGKTLVAAHAIARAAAELLQYDHPLILWLVPSNAILEQTYNALNDREHPYRQAIEATAGPLTVLTARDALHLQPSVLNAGVTVIVATMQAFRVNDTEGRKVYESSGALMPHFEGIRAQDNPGLDCVEGWPRPSLANLLFLRRPIVIVDEAHNARTDLSFDTLARFNPACILEFTATPDNKNHPSNVLYTVSAAELKAEAMIKMPVRVTVRPDWKELMADAISERNRLEQAAHLEKAATGEYIRPIMLLQAQPHYQSRPSLTVDVLRQALIDDFHIPPVEIAIATGERDEISGIDLASPACPLRYIITVQALREGWDCPFASILYSVAESTSNTAVEQILGRVLRMPRAVRKQNHALNLAYAFIVSPNFNAVLTDLEYSLQQNGFEKQEAREMLRPVEYTQPDMPVFQRPPLAGPIAISLHEPPALDRLPPDLQSRLRYDADEAVLYVSDYLDPDEGHLLRESVSRAESIDALEAAFPTLIRLPDQRPTAPAERGVRFSVPQLSLRVGQQLELFEDTAFLTGPFRLSRCDPALTTLEFTPGRTAGQVVQIDIADSGRLSHDFQTNLQHDVSLFAIDRGWSALELVSWLDRTLPHPDAPYSESHPFINALVTHLLDVRCFTLAQLIESKYQLRAAVGAKISTHRAALRHEAYQALLVPECETPLVVDPANCFTYPPDAYPYTQRYSGAYHFQKHYYPEIAQFDSDEEEACARYLDSLDEVETWVRNISGRPEHSFWLQTTTDRFYPDFVCRLTDGRTLIVEYKGADRWTTDDAKEKRALGQLYALRSNDACLFIMPNGPDWPAIHAVI